jgi:starch phosphorylase
MGLARLLVQGVDVWLNNPRPPLEASGTSGMKVAANGGLNLSVPDGWWAEARDHGGWSIGDGRAHEHDGDWYDRADHAELLRLLEEEIVPLWYRRGDDGLPAAWIDRMRTSLSTLPPLFDSARMVAEYRDRAYRPLADA